VYRIYYIWIALIIVQSYFHFTIFDREIMSNSDNIGSSVVEALALSKARNDAKIMATANLGDDKFPLRFRPVAVNTADVGTSIVRLHDLHLRSTDQLPILNTDSEIELAGDTARAFYKISLGSLVATSEILPDAMLIDFLHETLQTCEKLGTVGGITPLIATQLLRIEGGGEDGRAVVSDTLNRMSLLSGIADLPGGHQVVYVRDPKNIDFSKVGARQFADTFIGGNAVRSYRDRFNASAERLSPAEQEKVCIANGRMKAAILGIATGVAVFGGLAAARLGRVAVAGGVMAGIAEKETIEAGTLAICHVERLSVETDNAAQGPDGSKEKDSRDENSDVPAGSNEGDSDWPDDDETDNSSAGCIANPEWFNRADPYSRLTQKTYKSFLLCGRGLVSLIGLDNAQKFDPKMALSKDGRISISGIKNLASVLPTMIAISTQKFQVASLGIAGSASGTVFSSVKPNLQSIKKLYVHSLAESIEPHFSEITSGELKDGEEEFEIISTIYDGVLVTFTPGSKEATMYPDGLHFDNEKEALITLKFLSLQKQDLDGVNPWKLGKMENAKLATTNRLGDTVTDF
jgi:hypothetical protein